MTHHVARLVGCWLLAVACIANCTFAEAPAAALADFSGDWDTTYGRMRLTQTDAKVKGTYGPPAAAQKASIDGEVSGSRLTFTYTEPNAAGEGWFELAPDGRSFAGQWREQGQDGWQEWRGRRRGAVAAAPAADPADAPDRDTFTGVWKTAFGRMRLRQDGDDVRGVYEYGGGSHITGEVDGRTLKLRYDEPPGPAGAGPTRGEATFELSEDGMSFSGTLKKLEGPGGPGGGAWNGTRVVPQPGRVWLVVLEAPWEAGLEQEEYSYGLMLRTFFARAPHVRVRHRFFSDEADLRRWCAEVAYLAEPTVLYLSSHGTKEGVICGGQLVGADALIECVRDLTDLKLLHFGACLVAGGDIPRKIQEAGGRYPVSGFVHPADWGGSAVVDFAYLDLIFSRGLSPSDAAEQTRKMMSFARAEGEAGDAIRPAGLVVIEPEAASSAERVRR